MQRQDFYMWLEGKGIYGDIQGDESRGAARHGGASIASDRYAANAIAEGDEIAALAHAQVKGINDCDWREYNATHEAIRAKYHALGEAGRKRLGYVMGQVTAAVGMRGSTAFVKYDKLPLGSREEDPLERVLRVRQAS